MKYQLQVGFGRVDITPPNGVDVAGYYERRICDGVLDPIELNCLAVRYGEKTAVVITADVIGMLREYCEACKDVIVKQTGIEREGIFLHSIHSHTSVRMCFDENVVSKETIEFNKYAVKKFGQVAKLAMDDLQPAKLGYAVSKAERVGFNRRYLMKDGSYATNPGVNNPEIQGSAGEADERVNVLRFVREDGKNYVLADYGNHPDTIGGTKVSGDWPACARKTFERAIEDTKCIFFNGCQGDINHIIVAPEKGDMNGLTIDFDAVPRGYTQAKHIGNVIAGAILQVYEKVNYIDVDDLAFMQKEVEVPMNKATEEELPNARRIVELYEAGRQAELPYTGMALTTVIAEAKRILKMETEPVATPLLISALKIGKIGLIGLPGEPFNGVGVALKKNENYDLVLPVCSCNSHQGYFPMKTSYDEGGYEAKCSPFKAGVAELFIKEGANLLNGLLK